MPEAVDFEKNPHIFRLQLTKNEKTKMPHPHLDFDKKNLYTFKVHATKKKKKKKKKKTIITM
jgi:hypothetical protein